MTSHSLKKKRFGDNFQSVAGFVKVGPIEFA